MKILMLPSYCYPERISSSHLTDDLLEACYHAGFNVEMHVPTPCRGIDSETRKKYKKIKREYRFKKSVIINRFSLFSEGKNTIVRAVRYIICNIIQIHKGINSCNVDVIYSASTPPTQGLMCGLVKKILSKKQRKNIPFIYSLQDVFPDSMVSAGMTKKGSLIWRIGRILENYTYKSADKIIVISSDIRDNIIRKGVPDSKIQLIPNWIDINSMHHISRSSNILFDKFSIDRNKFIIVYAGNVGRAQGIDILVDAAEKIPDVEFVIFGDGSSIDDIKRKADTCDNVHIFPLQPMDYISEVYSMGDMGVVSCKKGLGNGAVPSKTFSIMAASTPILLSFDKETELWDLINKNKCGLCASSGNAEELVQAIQFARNHPIELNIMANNARKCVVDGYSKEVSTDKIIKLFASFKTSDSEEA